MSASNYCIHRRLNAAGQAVPKARLSAKRFFEQQFADDSDRSDRTIQAQLVDLSHSSDSMIAQQALLCLRCYISHHIVLTCIRLVDRYGRQHSFTLADLLPLVLDDCGKADFSKSLAFQILQKFDPAKSSLSTWTTRLVQQRSEMTQFLAEQGLILITDWAILNDTTPQQLRRILAEVCLLSQPEIDRAIAVLRAYHAVYRDEPNRSGRCVAPSITQLQKITQQLSPTRPIAPKVLLSQLQSLAKHLRQYRVWRKRGAMVTYLIDTLEVQPVVAVEHQVCALETQFLRRYRQALVTELDATIIEVLMARMQKFRAKQSGMPTSQQFLISLYSLYCKQQTMRAIATQMNLAGQYHVAKLLQLSKLRSKIQAELIQRLKPRLLPLLPVSSADLDRILHEELEPLFKLDAQYLQTPTMFRSSGLQSLFTRRMAHCLKRIVTAKRSLPATMAQVE